MLHDPHAASACRHLPLDIDSMTVWEDLSAYQHSLPVGPPGCPLHACCFSLSVLHAPPSLCVHAAWATALTWLCGCVVNCICQNSAQRPGMQEVLDSLERHTVCTGTQCFEGEADAFGLTVAPNNAPSQQSMFMMFMMFMAIMAFFIRMKKPTSSGDSKPGSSSSHSNDPPPPAVS